MGGSCSTYGRQESCTQGLWRNLRERDHLEDLGVDRRMRVQEVGERGMDWTDLAQVRDRWRALMNGVMNLRVS